MIAEFIKEITLFQKEGITIDELSFMKKSIGQKDAISFEAPWQKTRFLGRILHYDLDKSFVDDQNEIINTITQQEINALAKKHLPIDQMNILVAGDKESVKPGLEALGYEVIELDPRVKVMPSEMKQKLKTE